MQLQRIDKKAHCINAIKQHLAVVQNNRFKSQQYVLEHQTKRKQGNKCEYEEQKKEPTEKAKPSTQTMQIQYIQRIQMHDCEIYKCHNTRIQRMSSCIEWQTTDNVSQWMRMRKKNKSPILMHFRCIWNILYMHISLSAMLVCYMVFSLVFFPFTIIRHITSSSHQHLSTDQDCFLFVCFTLAIAT